MTPVVPVNDSVAFRDSLAHAARRRDGAAFRETARAMMDADGMLLDEIVRQACGSVSSDIILRAFSNTDINRLFSGLLKTGSVDRVLQVLNCINRILIKEESDRLLIGLQRDHVASIMLTYANETTPWGTLVTLPDHKAQTLFNITRRSHHARQVFTNGCCLAMERALNDAAERPHTPDRLLKLLAFDRKEQSAVAAHRAEEELRRTRRLAQIEDDTAPVAPEVATAVIVLAGDKVAFG